MSMEEPLDLPKEADRGDVVAAGESASFSMIVR